MKAYNFDENKIFKSDKDAYASPLEDGVFLLPANATWIKPPTLKQGEAARFNGVGWDVVPYFVGEIWYDTKTKEQVEIEKIGTPLSNLTPLVPGQCDVWNGLSWEHDPSLALCAAKSAKIAEIQAAMKIDSYKPVSVTASCGQTGLFDIVGAAKLGIDTAIAAFGPIGSVPDDYYWVDNANNRIPFTITDLCALATAASGWDLFNRLQLLKDKVNAAKTESEVASISWS